MQAFNHCSLLNRNEYTINAEICGKFPNYLNIEQNKFKKKLRLYHREFKLCKRYHDSNDLFEHENFISQTLSSRVCWPSGYTVWGQDCRVLVWCDKCSVAQKNWKILHKHDSELCHAVTTKRRGAWVEISTCVKTHQSCAQTPCHCRLWINSFDGDLLVWCRNH